MDEGEVGVGFEDGGIEEDEPDVYPYGRLVIIRTCADQCIHMKGIYTMPSVSSLIPRSSILSRVLSNAPMISPSGGPSLTNLSSEKASATTRFPEIGRLLAAEPGVSVMLVASLFERPRLWPEKVGVLVRSCTCF